MTERFRKYAPPISPDLRNQYESALANEFRWKNGFLFSDREESDLDHVDAMLRIHDEVSYKYPLIFSEVDGEDVSHMIYIHDAGEILAHDLSHSVPNYDAIRTQWKRRERAAFRLLTRDHIDDIELRAYVRGLYKRYEEKNPDDKQAHYVQFIDKLQALRFGAVNVFPARKLRMQAERLSQVNHIYGLIIKPSQSLFPLLSEGAQDELLKFTDIELLTLRENGYRASEVDPYRNLVNQELARLR